MNQPNKTFAPVERRGMTLLVVLMVVALLALGGYTFAEAMLAERQAAQAHGRRLQALAAADSGVAAALRFLAQEPAALDEAGGVYDNPARFRGALVADGLSAAERVRFTLLAPALIDGAPRGLRFGLEDESTRLNLNALLTLSGDLTPSSANNPAGVEEDNSAEDDDTADAEAALLSGALGDLDPTASVLMALPGMSEDIADAIIDWLDEDTEPRPLGAEFDYYSGLDPPYAPKNGPLDTIDELLMVRGVTPRLLFGLDQDRNGVIDARERALEAELGVDNADGAMDFGWAAYLTLHSAESNQQAGQPKIDINSDDLAQLNADLQAALGAEWATFIIAYRQFGPYTGSEQGQTGGATIDTTQPAKHQLTTVLDLIGPRVRVRGQGDDAEDVILETPFPDVPAAMNLYLPVLLDAVTVNSAPVIPGRININQAPRVVLAGIPQIAPETVEAILASRQVESTGDQPARRHETWLLSEGLVDLAEMKRLMPFVTAGGSVFRATVVGYTDAPGPSVRLEVLLDATNAAPRLLSWKDLSHLGVGYTKATLGGDFEL